MPQFTLDSAGRVPLIDLLPIVSKSARDTQPGDGFDSHLQRANSQSNADPASASSSTRPEATQAVMAEPDKPVAVQDTSAVPTQEAQGEEVKCETDAQGDKARSEEQAEVVVEAKDQAVAEDNQEDEDSEQDVVTIGAEAAAAIQQAATVQPESSTAGDQTEQVEAAAGAVGEDDSAAEAEKGEQPALPDQPPVQAAATSSQDSAVEEQKFQSAPIEKTLQTQVVQEAVADPAAEVTEAEVSQSEAEPDQTPAKAVQVAEQYVQHSDAPEQSQRVTANKPVVIRDPQVVPVATQKEADEEGDEPTAKSEAKSERPRTKRESKEAHTSLAAVSSDVPPSETKAQAQDPVSPDPVSAGPPENRNYSNSTDDQSHSAASTVPAKTTDAVATASSPVTQAESSSPAPHNAVPDAPVVRQAAAAGHAVQPQTADTRGAVDRARFVQRVQRAVHLAHERGGEVKLRLSPPELGNLRLELTLHKGVMTAKVEAETPAARTLLLENIGVLRDRLAEQNIQIERFDVDLMDRPPQDPRDGQPQDSRDPRRATFAPVTKGRGPIETESSAPRTLPQPGNAGQLNVII